jgi:hypothetical protein
MTTKNEIHALTAAEIDRQIRVHSERRQQIVAERERPCFSSALKNGTTNDEAQIVDADERAAREHAKNLLNGAAPANLALPAELSRDKMLYREQRGIDIALKILTNQKLVARAADAVKWAEAHAKRWSALCRELTLTAVKLAALEDSARELLVTTPFRNAISVRSVMGISEIGRPPTTFAIGRQTENTSPHCRLKLGRLRMFDHRSRWAWRPQEGPQQALVVRLRSFAVKLSWRRPIVSISAAKSSSCPREHPRTGPRPTEWVYPSIKER